MSFGNFGALLGHLVFVKASIWIEFGVFFLEVQPSADSALSQGSVKWGGLAGTPSLGQVPHGDTQLCALFLSLQMGCDGFLFSSRL